MHQMRTNSIHKHNILHNGIYISSTEASHAVRASGIHIRARMVRPRGTIIEHDTNGTLSTVIYKHYVDIVALVKYLSKSSCRSI